MKDRDWNEGRGRLFIVIILDTSRVRNNPKDAEEDAPHFKKVKANSHVNRNEWQEWNWGKKGKLKTGPHIASLEEDIIVC